MTQSIAKLVQILRDEQTFLANSREQCDDYEGERWDRIESIISYLQVDAAENELDSERLTALIGHAWELDAYSKKNGNPQKLLVRAWNTAKRRESDQKDFRKSIDAFIAGCGE